MELYNVTTKYPLIQLHIPTIKRYVLMVEYGSEESRWHICGVFSTLDKAKEVGPQLPWKMYDGVWYTDDSPNLVWWYIYETIVDMFIYPTDEYLASIVDVLPWDILKHRYMGDNT